MSGACLFCAATALYIEFYLKKQSRKFKEEEECGIVNHEQIKAARNNEAGNAVVVFRYIH